MKSRIRVISQCDVYSGLERNVTKIILQAHSEAPRNATVTQMSWKASHLNIPFDLMIQ